MYDLTIERNVSGTLRVPSANVAGTLRVPSAGTASPLEQGRGECRLSLRENNGDLADVTSADFAILEIEANGFLYNMVRTIVGTLVEVGRGARPETWPGEVLTAKDRRRAGRTAPPQGLFLVCVQYPVVPSPSGRG